MHPVLFVLLFLFLADSAHAQYVRIYAVVLANDEPANFMGGSSIGSGLWQSDDTGRTWKQLGWKHIKAFSMDHDSNGRVLYLAAGNGILKSTDFGESWKVMTDWRVAEAMDVHIVDRKPGTVLAATAHGVIKSTDYGVTWYSSHRGIAQPYASRLLIDQEIVYACNEEGLYRSEDYGETWKLIKQCGSAVRSVFQFKDLIVASGENSVCHVHHDGRVSSSVAVTHPLWTGYYSPGLNKRFVAGPRGTGAFENSADIVFTGPKNVHCLTSINRRIFAGTLGEGIWIQETSGEWQPLALPKTQVWTIKTAYIR